MNLRVAARSASVVLKLAAVVAGGIAAYLWYRSAVTADGAFWNKWAALLTALSEALQAASLLIDSLWVPPTASWS